MGSPVGVDDVEVSAIDKVYSAKYIARLDVARDMRSADPA